MNTYLDGIKSLALPKQVRCILGEKRVDFLDIVLAALADGQIPLIQSNANLDRLLDLQK